MKIVQTKKDSVLIECDYDECRELFTKGKESRMWKDDIEKFCRDGVEISINEKVKAFSRTHIKDVESAILTIKSTLTFLENKAEALKGGK